MTAMNMQPIDVNEITVKEHEGDTLYWVVDYHGEGHRVYVWFQPPKTPNEIDAIVRERAKEVLERNRDTYLWRERNWKDYQSPFKF